ncbi:hypothetical protein Kfla_2385 [Kribbella flavida DSM 17836]|uniref:Uncharacterized protein n=1 Tax=Kribbella flavida (strain DSM 17836 / JCM 10339 / NBRC 14399) TaxID=479435 RepID=D2PUZ3_KRIFD|nr:hypothetical protein [Kribbella flavida]ADB31459.1 hypothetical protein Kfla_2385 [Kribbella flavida DSM 17836]
MTDTETRLRDYLHARAASVADDAEPPGLDESATPKRHLWPVLMAAAAIGAVLVLVVPLVARVSGPDRVLAERPGTGLGVPFVLGTDALTLHDGETSVPLDVGLPSFRDTARVDGGWLIQTQAQGTRSFRLGLLRTDGSVKPFGPADTLGFRLSPDRRHVVTAVPADRGKTRLVILDVATGAETDSMVAPMGLITPTGWNHQGVWLIEEYSSSVKPQLWRPGTDRLVELDVPEYAAHLIVQPGTERVLAVTRKGGATCLRAGTPRDGGLAVDREQCGAVKTQVYAALSLDGATMVNLDQRLAVDVATGRRITLELPGDRHLSLPRFEDATHLLVVATDLSSGGSAPPETVFRCDVTTGACRSVYNVPAGTRIGLGLS